MTYTDKILEYTMYDLRGEWASETNKKEILSQLNKKLKIKIAQALAEEREKVREKGAGEVKWNKKETMQIIIKDNGTALATTWEGYYATDVKLPTIAAAAEGVFFNEEQTKAVNALVSTSIQQAIAEERERVVEEISALDGHYTNVTNEKDVYERGFAVGYDTGWNDVLLKLRTALLSPQQSNPNKNI